jgi:hypothetical protein
VRKEGGHLCNFSERDKERVRERLL